MEKELQSKQESLALIMLGDQIAQELLVKSKSTGLDLEEALQVASITKALLFKLHPDRKRAIEVVMEAEATLKLVSGNLISN